MKQIRLLLVLSTLVAAAASPASGQESRDGRLSVGVGLLTAPDIVDALNSAVLTAFTLGSHTIENRSGNLGLSVQYERFLGGPFALLGGAGFQRTEGEIFSGGAKKGTLSSRYFYLMAGGSVHYLRRRVGLFSSLAVGGAHDHDEAEMVGGEKNTNSAIRPAFQVTALGIRGGGRNLSGFMEMGFGYRGMLVFGVAYEF